MDFGALAKQGMKMYQDSQNSGDQQQQQQQQQQGAQGFGQHQGDDQSQPFGVQGGAHLNSSDNNRPSSGGMDFDPQAIAQHASSQSNGDSSLFASAMSFLNQGGHDSQIDEQGVQQAHAEAYSQGNTNNMSSQSLGAAAAVNALKSFTSGSGGQQQAAGGSQNQLIAMAMAEAKKLFDNNPTGNAQQEDIMSSAGATMVKLLVQSKMSGMTGAGSGGGAGGLSGLMGMAQQFMK